MHSMRKRPADDGMTPCHMFHPGCMQWCDWVAVPHIYIRFADSRHRNVSSTRVEYNLHSCSRHGHVGVYSASFIVLYAIDNSDPKQWNQGRLFEQSGQWCHVGDQSVLSVGTPNRTRLKEFGGGVEFLPYCKFSRYVYVCGNKILVKGEGVNVRVCASGPAGSVNWSA